MRFKPLWGLTRNPPYSNKCSRNLARRIEVLSWIEFSLDFIVIDQATQSPKYAHACRSVKFYFSPMLETAHEQHLKQLNLIKKPNVKKNIKSDQ